MAKLLIDRATRAKIQAEGRRGLRHYRPTQHVEAVKTVFFPTGDESRAEP